MVERSNKPSAISATAPAPDQQATVDSDDTRVTARLPTGEAVSILLHGATITSWQSAGARENLWLSDAAVLDGSKPVRGGIPVVFPVFGRPPPSHATSAMAQHGFARTTKWEFLGKSTSEAGTAGVSVKLDFGLYAATLAPAARAAWPHAFGLVYSVTLSPDGLSTVMSVRNDGPDPFDFQFLLHTYFRVRDISKVTVTGLGAASYVDKVLDATAHTQSTPELKIAGEVDRVYRDLKVDTTSILEYGKPRFDVVRDNLTDTVVWNPWTAKAAAMADFAPKDGFQHMLCVEVGTVSGWQRLETGDTFEAGQILKSHL